MNNRNKKAPGAKRKPDGRRPLLFTAASALILAVLFCFTVLDGHFSALAAAPDSLDLSALDESSSPESTQPEQQEPDGSTPGPVQDEPVPEPPAVDAPALAPDSPDVAADATTFTVEFVDWDNTPLSLQTVIAGQGAVAPAQPTREGFAFTGWDGDFSQVHSNLSIRALYEPLEAFTVIIQYVMLDGSTAAQPYIATIPKGSSLNDTVPHPILTGYLPQSAADYPQQDTELYSDTQLTLDIQSITANHTYTVAYVPYNMVEYRVNYYLPRLSPATGYDKITLAFAAETATTVEAPTQPFKGFSPPISMPSATIASDGSTEIDVYYTRNQVTLFFDTDGGSYVEPISGLFGSAVTAPQDPQKQGYTFLSWNMDVPQIMPGEDQIFTALWDEPNTAGYTVAYWIENANDYGYTLVYSEVRQGAVGKGFGSGTDEVNLNSSAYWAPESYFPGIPADAKNDVYQELYPKNTTKTANENAATVITADGTAVFHVYFSRFVFNYTFDLGTDTGYYIVQNGGTKYYEKQYSFTAKFGADLTAVYPSAPQADDPSVTVYWKGYNSNWVSSLLMAVLPRSDIPAVLCCYRQSTSGGYYYSPRKDVTLILQTTTSPMDYYPIELYVQNLDDPSQYNLLREYSYYVPTAGDSRLICPNIAGFGPPSPTEFKVSDTERKAYYYRLQFNIHFTSGGQNIHTESNIWFEEKLAGYYYEPTSPPASMPGYTFGGWYTSPLLLDETAFDFENGHTMPASDIILYAKWDKPTFTVQFEPLNGDGVTTQTYEYGDYITPPAAPKKDGYRFVGWKESGKQHLYMLTNPVVRNLDLVAVWEPTSGASYTIRYINKSDGKPLEDTGFVTGQQAGATITETALEIPGFLPDAVSKSIVLKADADDNEIIFYYVPFDSVDYVVKYQTTDGGTLLVDTTKSTGNTRITENFVRIPGYYPVRAQLTLQLSANHSDNVLVFQYVRNGDAVYTVEHHLQNLNGIGYYPHPGGPDTMSAPAGLMVTAKPRTVTGFTLNTTVSDSMKTVNSSGNTVLHLYYDRSQYTIEFRAQNGGSLEGVTSFGAILYGTAFRDAAAAPTPKADSGYEFAGWSPALPDPAFAITANAVYTATFRKPDVPPTSSSSETPPPSSSSSSSEPPPTTSSTPPASSSSSRPTPSSSSSTSTAPPGTSSSAPLPGTGSTPNPGGPGETSTGTPDTYEEIRRETLEQMEEDGVPYVVIGDQEIPLYGFGYKTVWALLNLILAILGAVIAILLVIGAFFKKKGENDEQESAEESSPSTANDDDVYSKNKEEQQKKRRLLWRIVATVVGLLGIIVFLLTENMHYLMVFIDKWTILMVVLALADVVCAILVHVNKKDPQKDNAQQEDT